MKCTECLKYDDCVLTGNLVIKRKNCELAQKKDIRDNANKTAEYIERNELIGNLKYFAPEYYSALIDTLIKNQPAADVEPVRHGRWETPIVGVYGCMCSLCKKQADNDFDYCPNCGAKMDKRDGDKNG